MIKHIIIYIFFFINIYYCYSQNKNDSEYVINYAKGAFLLTDTVYTFSKVATQSGYYDFYIEYINHFKENEKTNYYYKDKNNEIRKVKLKFEYDTNLIDTVNDYFTKSNLTHATSFNELKEKIRFSYILEKLNMPMLKAEKENIFRLIIPCHIAYNSNQYYIVKVLFNNNTAKIYSYFINSNKINSIAVENIDSSQLKKFDVNRIKNKFYNINNKDVNICLNKHNNYLLETMVDDNYEVFIIAYDCYNRDYKKVLKLISLIDRLNSKYFGNRCAKNPAKMLPNW